MEEAIKESMKRAKTEAIDDMVIKLKDLCTKRNTSQNTIIELLDDVRRQMLKIEHKELNFYTELHRQAVDKQGTINISDLVIQSLNTGTDKIFQAVTKCMKVSKLSENKSQNQQEGKTQREGDSQASQSRFGYPSSGFYPPMQYQPTPWWPHQPYQQDQYMPRPNIRGRGRGFRGYGGSPRGRGACLICKSTEHYVKDCDLNPKR